MKRIIVMLTLAALLVVALTATAGLSFADPNCTGPPGDRPGACKITERGQGNEQGPPGPGKFVGPGGGGDGGPNKPPGQTNNPNPGK
jgi:hypothetical protein